MALSPASPTLPLPTPPISFLGFAALVFIYIIISYLVIGYIPQPEDSNDVLQSRGHNALAFSVEESRKMPCFEYDTAKSSICAICLEDFQSSERCRRFPGCNHVFHAFCIDLWLVKRLNCTICRAPLQISTNLDVV